MPQNPVAVDDVEGDVEGDIESGGPGEPELASVQGSDTYPTYFAPLEAAGLLEALPPEGDYALTDEVTLQSGFVRHPTPQPLPCMSLCVVVGGRRATRRGCR